MAQIQVLDVMSQVSQICRECPNTVLIQAYVDAARVFCNRSRWLKATITGATVVDKRTYSLGSDPYNEIFGISGIDIEEAVDDTHPLTERVSSKWDTNVENGVPELYQYVPEAQLALHPKPDAVYNLTIGLVLQPKSGVNSIDDSLLVSWEYALQAGALAYLLGRAITGALLLVRQRQLLGQIAGTLAAGAYAGTSVSAAFGGSVSRGETTSHGRSYSESKTDGTSVSNTTNHNYEHNV